HDREVRAARKGVQGLGYVPLRGVVFHEHRRQVPARRSSSEPLRREFEFLQALEHDDVEIGFREFVRGDLPRAGGPVSAGSTDAERVPRSGGREEVLVLPAYERIRPTSVHVLEQDFHWAAPSTWAEAKALARSGSKMSCSHASATRAGATPVRQRCSGTGQGRAQVLRHGARLSPSRIVGTLHDANRTAGTTGEKRLTILAPMAAARWAGPVFPVMTTCAPPRRRAISTSVVRPPRSIPPRAAT